MYLAKLASGAAITAMVLAGSSTMVFAQTTGSSTGGTGSTTSTGTTVTSTTPGVPNTGAGGDVATNLTLLGVSALALIGGGAYLARQRFAR